MLGRTGEAKPDRPVQLALKHRDFKEPVHVTLKTDARGRVVLGRWPTSSRVTATGPEGVARTPGRCRATGTPTGRRSTRRAGETVALPYLGRGRQAARHELALFEVARRDVSRADRFDALAIKDGLVELARPGGGRLRPV